MNRSNLDRPLNRGRTKTVPLFLLLFLAFIPVGGSTPSITDNDPVDGATTYFDDFSERTGTTDFGETLGTYGASGTGFASFMDTGAENWVFQAPSSGATQNFAAYTRQYDPCTDEDLFTARFDVKLTTNPTVANEIFYVTMGGTGSAVNTAPQLGVSFTWDAGTGLWQAQGRAVGENLGSVAAAATLSGLVVGTTVSVEINGLQCASAQALIFLSDGTNSDAGNVDATDAFINGELNPFAVWQTAETHNGGRITLDNVEIVSGTITPATGDLIFCSDITETGTYPFGYNYKTTGVTAVSVSGSGENNALTFVGEDQVAAKGWTPGSNAIKAYFNVRARSDGETSYFNVALSTVTVTPSVTTYGNGENTQAFADHVRLKMTEGPTYWQGAFYYASGGGAITGLGPSFTMHESNLFTNYYLIMDTDAADLSIALYRQNSDLLVAERDLPAAFSGDVIYSEWLIGNDVTASAGQTDLIVGSQLSDSFSTCIYDLAGDGSAPIGSPGSADTGAVPPDDQPDTTPDPDASGNVINTIRANLEDGFGFDFGWILTIMVVGFFVVAFASYNIGGLPGALIISFAVIAGIGVSIAVGFSPIWLLFMFALIVAAVFVWAVMGRGDESSG